MQALGPASWDWQERKHKLVWKFKRVQGGADITLKVGTPHPAHSLLLETGQLGIYHQDGHL